jgi:predicted dehydrogenase
VGSDDLSHVAGGIVSGPIGDRPVRWAILGAGGIAATVGSDIQASPTNEVAAVGARDLGRARALADQLGAPRAYGSYAELVADEADVVYIATTHGQHHEHALLALSAGKPVMVEKAFTLNARQAREVIGEARRRRLFCMEAMWMRCTPLIRLAQEWIAEGRIGAVRSVAVDLSVPFPYDPTHRLYDLAVGGGAMLDLGVYSSTFAYLFLGAPTSVTATGALAPTGADTTIAMQWAYGDDRYAHVACTSQGPSSCRGEVRGTEGYLQVGPRFHYPDTLTSVAGPDRDTETVHVEVPGKGYGPEIDEVERCLRSGLTESPLVPLDDTLAIMEIMDDARAQVGVRYPAAGE